MSSRVSPVGFLVYPLILALSLALVSTPHPSSAHKTSQPAKNVTITVPQNLNITDHGDHHLLCTPTRWFDVATFFIGNFVAHAATVKSLPGEPALLAFAGKIYALLFPTSGLIRGLKGIYQHAILCKTPLETASSAGALCTVVRLPNWKPRTGDRVKQSMVSQATEKQRPGDQEGGDREAGDWEAGLQEIERRQSGDRGVVDKAPPEIRDMVEGDAGAVLQEAHLELEKNPSAHDAQIPDGQPAVMSLLDTHGSIPVTWDFSDFRPKGDHTSFLPSVGMPSIQGRKIHGTCCLPPGYALALLPPRTPVSGFDKPEVPKRPPPPDSHWWLRLWAALMRWMQSGYRAPEQKLETDLFPTRDPDMDFFVSDEVSSSYSFSKGLIAVLQVIFASVTLYRTRGDQIQRYGYAAFGLTVSPYLVMSVINLTSTMLTPDYPALYLVASDIMVEASRREGRFEGVVGSVIANDEGGEELAFDVRPDGNTFLCRVETLKTLDTKPARGGEATQPAAPAPEPQQPDDLRVAIPLYPGGKEVDWSADSFLAGFSSLYIGSIAIAIIGGLSRFKPGESTKAQRVWTMLWLILGILVGPASLIAEDDEDDLPSLWYYVAYCAPAIGGFVVVAQMLLNYGTCVRIY